MKKRVILIPFLILSIVFLSACGSKDLDVNKTKKDKFGTLSYEVPEDFSKESVDKIEDSSLTFQHTNTSIIRWVLTGSLMMLVV